MTGATLTTLYYRLHLKQKLVSQTICLNQQCLEAKVICISTNMTAKKTETKARIFWIEMKLEFIHSKLINELNRKEFDNIQDSV